MPETWTLITKENARAAMADGEWEMFANGALTPGGSDPVTQGIRTVVGMIRGAVGASGKNTLGPEGMVPPELEGDALILLLETLSTRVPSSGIVWDEVRKNRLKEAKDTLKEIRKGDYKTTPPEAETGAEGDSGGWGGDELVDFGPTIYTP